MYIPEQGERTLNDFRNWSKFQGTYYERNPKDKNQIRTRLVSYNVFAGKYVVHQPTNWITAEPTPDMKPWHEGISRAVFTMQPTQSASFY